MNKKLIRHAVFETNSRSCHSISISNSVEINDSIYPNEDGNIELTGGTFGWEVEDYNDADTKANYIAVMITMLRSSRKRYRDVINQGKDPVEHFKYYSLPPFAEEHYVRCKKNFEEVLKEQTSCNKVIYNFSDDWDHVNYSYIDHQSFENKEDAQWLLDKDQIKAFIFNKNSVLHTDNDNH